MEKRKILVKNLPFQVEFKDEKIYIGTSPKLIVDLKTQRNVIRCENEDIPYKKEVKFSPDLLQGKRPWVFATAVKYYYEDACKISEETKIAREYGKRANRTVMIKNRRHKNI